MEEQKKKRGRPATVNSKGNKEYFREYYHATKKTEICECGVTICTKARSKHVKSKLHNNLLQNSVQRQNSQLRMESSDSTPAIKNRDRQELDEPELNVCNII